MTAFIAGATAPSNKRMGHAGAIISGRFGTVESKRKSLKEAGVTVVRGLDEILNEVKATRENRNPRKWEL